MGVRCTQGLELRAASEGGQVYPELGSKVVKRTHYFFLIMEGVKICI
jgi:hypothetical protein